MNYLLKVKPRNLIRIYFINNKHTRFFALILLLKIFYNAILKIGIDCYKKT